MKSLSRLSVILLVLIALVCLTACPAPYHSGSQPSDSTMMGEITKIVGTGEVRINDRIVHEGAAMRSGDHIETVGDARTTLKLARGGEVLFDADTDPILQWVSAAFCKLRILINVGSILVDTPCVTEAETGSGAVINTLGTTFHLAVTSAWTELTVIKGKVAIRSNVGGRQIVSAGYQCRVLRNRQAPPPVWVDTRSVHDWACRLDRRLCRERSQQQRDVSVPNVVGTELDQAQQILSRNSLQLGRVRETATKQRFDDRRVFAQSPRQGAWVPADAEVDLSVWRYRAITPVMPLLVNRPIEEAETVLKESGIRLGRIGALQTRDPWQDGRVARQSPRAGTRIGENTVAALTVYRHGGPPPTGDVLVPNVVGIELDRAQQILSRNTLKVGRVRETVTERRSDDSRVIAQSPRSGTRIPANTAVDLSVAYYRAAIKTMPMLVNRPLGEAEAVLKESGIRLGRIGELSTGNPRQNGRVARQSPGAGSRIQRDTVAMLTVYRYERPPVRTVNVPPLVGMHIDKARAELERAGLTVGRVVTEPAPSSRQIGLVFRQQPGAGTGMKRGSSVNVWIYQQKILQRPGFLRLQPVQ
jgi:beta-lactam-binding protein with PASTA domain